MILDLVLSQICNFIFQDAVLIFIGKTNSS